MQVTAYNVYRNAHTHITLSTLNYLFAT